MDFTTLFERIEQIVDRNGVAVLATVDADGRPHARWMAPALLRGQKGALYAVSLPEDAKISQIEHNPRVSWVLQSQTMDQVVEASGRAIVVDNPSLRASVLEAIAARLERFWKLHPEVGELVVVETAIDRIAYLEPETGVHEVAEAPR